MVSFPQRTVSVPFQPARSCIIFHPLGFVFHAHAVSGLVITASLIEIQTSTHGLQSPFNKIGPIRGDTQFIKIFYKIKKLVPDFQ
jgi:hypothetical protein